MASEYEAHLEGARKAVRRFKIAFALALAIMAGVGGYLVLFRGHPAEATLKKAFRMAEKGDFEGIAALLDPEGPLSTLLRQNDDALKKALEEFLERYRLEISSPTFRVRSEKNRAEVEVTGGTVRVYARSGSDVPVASLGLRDSGLVFYLERKDGNWLVEDVNQDITQWTTGEGLPFNW